MEIRAKKSLGQNFLKDDSVIEQILVAAEIQPEDKVFEIGPGTGRLTEKLAGRVKRVLALEIDDRLVKELQMRWPADPVVTILGGDILTLDIDSVFATAGFQRGQYKVVANLPYYITAPIIRRLLTLAEAPESLTLMVQKEVAERMTALPGKMSLLSLMAQYYSDAKLVFVVPKEAFEPMPKVASAVIQLRPKRPYDKAGDRAFFRLARAGFAARRKTLVNNLASSLQLDRRELENILTTLGLRTDIRAQALSLSDWERLQNALGDSEPSADQPIAADQF